jgi:aspartate-semialdehyde dehydrogenase
VTSRGARIGVLGATGALGGEVLAALDASTLRIAEIVPIATDRSLGEDIEFQGETYPVQAELPRLRGLDLLFCCAPVDASLELVREALKAEVQCIDCSGALIASEDVPVRVGTLPASVGDEGAPIVTVPAGPALPWALVLAPLQQAAGLRRVVGSVLDAASVSGREGIEALSAGSLALFSLQEPAESEAIVRPLAFDCLPAVGEVDANGSTARETMIATGLRRLLGADLPIAVTVIQVPAFVGQASSLAIETERLIEAKEVEDLLAGATGVELWDQDAEGPNLRAAAGRDVVLVGRVRNDPTVPHGILLWMVADMLRLTAAHAVEIATARLQSH